MCTPSCMAGVCGDSGCICLMVCLCVRRGTRVPGVCMCACVCVRVCMCCCEQFCTHSLAPWCESQWTGGVSRSAREPSREAQAVGSSAQHPQPQAPAGRASPRTPILALPAASKMARSWGTQRQPADQTGKWSAPESALNNSSQSFTHSSIHSFTTHSFSHSLTYSLVFAEHPVLLVPELLLRTKWPNVPLQVARVHQQAPV